MERPFESESESCAVSDQSSNFSPDWQARDNKTISDMNWRTIDTAQNTVNEKFPELILERGSGSASERSARDTSSGVGERERDNGESVHRPGLQRDGAEHAESEQELTSEQVKDLKEHVDRILEKIRTSQEGSSDKGKNPEGGGAAPPDLPAPTKDDGIGNRPSTGSNVPELPDRRPGSEIRPTPTPNFPVGEGAGSGRHTPKDVPAQPGRRPGSEIDPRPAPDLPIEVRPGRYTPSGFPEQPGIKPGSDGIDPAPWPELPVPDTRPGKRRA